MKTSKTTAVKFSDRTLAFIAKAKKQKRAEWLDEHRDEYEAAIQNPMRALMDYASKELKEETKGYRFPLRNVARLRRSAERAAVDGLYRDWIGVSVSPDSKSRYDSLPNLYFHIDEDDVLSAGGLYMPSASQTRHIRAWIDHDPSKLDELFADRKFKKFYPDFGRDRVLKTKPRDYPLEHPRIEWLKLSGFYVWKGFTKKEFHSKEFPALLVEHWTQVLRLNKILNVYCAEMPKKNGIAAMPAFQAPKLDWED